MNYISTRNNKLTATAAEAIANGISKEGGLFVPEHIPTLNSEDFSALAKLDYKGRAKYILKYFLTDFTENDIDYCVEGAYTGSFEEERPAPIAKLGDKINVLELWHGPTCAFKDLALQLLPYLLSTAAKKVNEGKETVILVATSGDTGKAALEGFRDVENTKIIVFYPCDGVSPMQKLQMDTQAGENVYVCSIKGNFDDAQTGVKQIFTNKEIIAKLAEKNKLFSSANSINWGRLVPQIIYYVSAYCDLLANNEAKDGFNVVVPTGNFGNILAAYYAKVMGVPIKKLICASNANNVLTDFINTGVYDRNRPFHTTISPSMDILISSNLERMLFELSGNDSEKITAIQNSLSENGTFKIEGEMLEKLQNIFYGGCCDDDKTKATIKEIFEKYGYLSDTHTAVAFSVYEDYVKATGDNTPVVIASTASPYKFAKSVLSALGEATDMDEFDILDNLSEFTKTDIPAPISNLKTAKVRFSNCAEKQDMAKVVFDFLNI